MKKNIINIGKVWAASLILLTSCSGDKSLEEWAGTGAAPTPAEADGQFTYTMHLDGGEPGFKENETRTTYTWADGSIIYLRLSSGSSYVTGTATYNSSTATWTLSTSSSLATSTSSSKVEAYYFENPGTVTSSTVTLTELTAVYMGTGTYTHPSSNDIYVTATLSPQNWRLRFSGSSGSSVAVSGSKSNIRYFTSFNRSTGSLNSGQKDVTLNVASNGYTPYLYGTWASSGNNTLYVTTDAEYYRTINSSSLAIGNTAYTNRPTSGSYSPWTKVETLVANCDVKPSDFISFSGGFASDFSLGSTVSYARFLVLSKAYGDQLTDTEVLNALSNPEYYVQYTREELLEDPTIGTDFNPNTDYYFYALGYSSQGKRGNLTRYQFRTKSNTNQPVATITSLTESIDAYNNPIWRIQTTLSNTRKYYMLLFEANISDQDYLIAWYTKYWIKTNQITESSITSTSATDTRTRESSAANVTVFTWAFSSTGEMSGVVDVKHFSRSSARAFEPDSSDLQQDNASELARSKVKLRIVKNPSLKLIKQ